MHSSRSVNVLHLSTAPGWGGGQHQTLLLLQGLLLKGMQPHITLRKGGALEARLPAQAPALPLSMRSGMNLITVWRLARYCRAHRCESLPACT